MRGDARRNVGRRREVLLACASLACALFAARDVTSVELTGDGSLNVTLSLENVTLSEATNAGSLKVALFHLKALLRMSRLTLTRSKSRFCSKKRDFE